MTWDDRKGKVRPRRKKAMTEYDLYQDNIKRYEKKLGRPLKWYEYETDNKTGKTTKKTDEYWKMLDDEEGGKGTYYTPNKKKNKKTEHDHYLEAQKKKKKKKPVKGILEEQGY